MKKRKPSLIETPAYRPETRWDRLCKRAAGEPSPIFNIAYRLFATFVVLRILTSSLNGVEDEGLHDMFLGYLSRWGIQFQTATNYLWYGVAAALLVYITTLPRAPIERIVNRILFVLFVVFLIWYFTRPTL